LHEVPPVRHVAAAERREQPEPGFTRGERARAYVDAAKGQEMEYLDIPAFLRRQAD
jgi:hypothetical protein